MTALGPVRAVVVAAIAGLVVAAGLTAGAPVAGAAPLARPLVAKAAGVTFTTTYARTPDGGRLAWRLDAARLGATARVEVRLVVPYGGKPLALTLCTACRSSEVGQAVVAPDLGKEIAAGRSTVEIDPARGKTLKAALR